MHAAYKQRSHAGIAAHQREFSFVYPKGTLCQILETPADRGCDDQQHERNFNGAMPGNNPSQGFAPGLASDRRLISRAAPVTRTCSSNRRPKYQSISQGQKCSIAENSGSDLAYKLAKYEIKADRE
jgi:hypothetical protein